MSFTTDSVYIPIQSGNNWIDSLFKDSGFPYPGLNVNFISLSRTYVTYTFDSLPDDPDAIIHLETDISGNIGFTNIAQQSAIRMAINYISDLLGIEFREVSGVDADWYFFQGDITDPKFAAWYNGYWTGWQESDQLTEINLDLWLILDNSDGPQYQSWDKGTYAYTLILHELGHLLGLAHPFDGTILDDSLPNAYLNTVMSYDWVELTLTTFPSEYLPYDIAALVYLYGYDGLAGEYGVGTDARIVLGVENATSVVGSETNDTIIGTDGDEALVGGDGNDILIGKWGANEHHGGSGSDTVRLTLKSTDYSLSKSPISGDITLIYESGANAGSISSDVEKIEFLDGITITTDSVTYTGIYNDDPGQAVNPIYRFYNTRDKAYFYTESKDEKDYVLTNSAYTKPDSNEWPYVYQGSTFEAAHSYLDSSTLVPVFRFYNYETGHHFFTVSEAESEMIKGKIASGEWPFNYEGTRFNMYSGDPNPNSVGDELAVHRFYSPSLNRHFFTGDAEEASKMQLTGIWNYEGVGFYGEILG